MTDKQEEYDIPEFLRKQPEGKGLQELALSREGEGLGNSSKPHYAQLIERIAQLKAENEKLLDRNEKLESCLWQVRNWCKAYPIKVFTEPDWKVVQEKLGATLLTRVSGSNMRHVVSGIQTIIDSTIDKEAIDKAIAQAK